MYKKCMSWAENKGLHPRLLDDNAAWQENE